MELRSYLSSSLEIAENKAKYDAQVKAILSDKDILAWILKFTVKELKDFDISTIKQCIEGTPDVGNIPVYPGKKEPNAIVGMSNEDAVPNEGKITYDIRFSVRTPDDGHIKMFINIEAQKKYHPGYDLVTRAIFYCARMLSGQLDREFEPDNYDDIRKVYSIWICMDVPEYAENTITSYEIQQNKLFGDFSGKARYDLLSAVMVALPKDGDSSNGAELHKLLSTVLSESMELADKERILNDKFHIATSRTLKEGLNLMCNLSDRIEEKALEKGMQQGIQQGMEKGKITAYVEMIKEGFITLADAAKKLRISESELSKYM